MAKSFLALVKLATAITLAAPAAAEVITFDPLAFNGSGSTPPQTYSSVTVGDYVFTALQAFNPLVVRARNDPDNADIGGATLGITTSGSELGLSFARVDGSAFDFTGFQATHYSNALLSPGNGGTLAVYFDGAIGLQTSYDINPGFQTYAPSGVGVHSVRITSNNFFQIDNLTVSGTSAVPEPAMWTMLVGGFAMVGGAMRRGRMWKPSRSLS